MSSRARGLRRVAIGGAVTASLLVAGVLPAGGAGGYGQEPQVRVATTGNDSERVKTLHITRRHDARRRVVMSLGPGRMPNLIRGDRIRLTAELQVTTDCNSRGPRCRGSVYHYNPHITARLVLAPSQHLEGRRRTLAVSRVVKETCAQKRPHYEHHCVLVLRQAGFHINRPRRLPCKLSRCHVNLVVEAHHPRADPGDLLMVGGQKPNGKIPQDRGRINAIRLRSVSPSDYRRTGTRELRRHRIRADFKRRVVISKKLRGLKGGEQLAVDASFRTDISGFDRPLRASARLILAESPRATRQGDLVKRRAFSLGEIAENNGSNCTRHDSPCTYNKVGVLTLRHDARDRRGRARPLYVNLVTVLGAKHRSDSGNRVRIRRGSIRVIRFPPGLRG